MKSYEEILVDIGNMSDDEVVNIWNEYCDHANDEDDKIYPIDTETGKRYHVCTGHPETMKLVKEK